LHLSGYDHQTASEKKVMWEKQAELLRVLGIEMDKFSGDD
jgi:ssRNA-specific RNase YbeY (16S rRNA maturation enzyme)